MTTTVLHVSGMSCQNCVRHVTEALHTVAGVDSVEVSLEEATATVSAREAVAHGALAAAVREAGYTVTE